MHIFLLHTGMIKSRLRIPGCLSTVIRHKIHLAQDGGLTVGDKRLQGKILSVVSITAYLGSNPRSPKPSRSLPKKTTMEANSFGRAKRVHTHLLVGER